MKRNEYIILEADDGMMLTNGEAYGKTVVLANNEAVSKYHEITEEKYRELMVDAEATDREPNT